MRYRVMKPYKHKKSSNPWFRRVVPADLRDIVGKREIKQSLGAVSHADAVAQIAKLDAQWTGKFARLRRERIIDERLLAVEYCDVFFSNIRSKSTERADRAILIMLRMVADAMVLAWGRRAVIETGADGILDYALDDGELLEEEAAEAEVIPETDRAQLVARLRAASINPSTFGAAFREVIAYALKQERWHWFAFPVTMVEDAADVTIRPTAPLYGLVAAEMARRLIDYRSPRWDEQLLRSLGFLTIVRGDQEEISVYAAQPAEPPTNLGAANVPATVQGKRLSDAFALWEKLAAPKPSAVIEATRCRLRFVNLFGDLPLEAISKSTISCYRDRLMDLPKGTQIEKLNAAGVKLSDFITNAKAAESEGRIDKSLRVMKIDYDRLHPTSIKKDIGALSAVFGIAVREDWMVSNPCNTVTIANYSKSRRAQGVRRKPLSKAMLAKMFDTPSFTG